MSSRLQKHLLPQLLRRVAFASTAASRRVGVRPPSTPLPDVMGAPIAETASRRRHRRCNEGRHADPAACLP